jgi:hypothetical protein
MGKIITFDELMLEGVDSPPENLGRVERLIVQAEETVESMTGRMFSKRDAVTLWASGFGTALLNLDHPPIAITTVEVEGVALDGTTYEIESSLIGEIGLFEPKLRRLDDSVWPKGDRNIKIVGSFGHVMPQGTNPETYAAPPMVKRLVTKLVMRWLPTLATSVSATGRGEIVREKLGSAEFEYAQGTSSRDWLEDKELAGIINRYRRLRIGSV